MSNPLDEGYNDDEIEELLTKAKEESLRFYNEVELPRQNKKNGDEQEDYVLSTQVGGKAGTFLYEGNEAKGFHLAAGSTYIYPTNYPVRQYQASIVKTALFKNTLVSLPTGLGKTFIAAVVMYNFYRWYPHGKVVFMAPTRPLVAQQLKACYHIMNIPKDDTTEMTGMQAAEQRATLWQNKRVFFLTPQVMVNDLKGNTCPSSLIKCVVIDEAHRATKDYAYCQVLNILSETDAVFRVLGLSATPGNDVAAVQQVIKNLQITAFEMRSEESLDVAPYIHSRDIQTVVVELTGNILRVKDDLLQVFEKYAKKLKDFKALSYNISNITKFQVLKACEKFRGNPPRGVPPAIIGSLISDFTVCMSLAHSLELLQIYGLRAFYTYLSDDGEKTKAASTRLRNDEHLKEMLKRLQACLFPRPDDNFPYTWGHPKLEKLVGALSEHFKTAQENKTSTKAIVFCQYRVVVTEIVEILNKCKPLIKPAEFIGQSGGKEKGMPQAKQLQIMKDFRNGFINCLVATCVAEEGLDIGEVDLIILMEAHKSPVRLVQRLGRTGRKRKGFCIVLLTKGKEELKFRDAMATRKSYIQNIVNSPAVKSSLCLGSPRMIPAQCNPVQQLVHIQASNIESPGRPSNKKQVDIRKCFNAQAPGTSHSSDDDLLKALEELGGCKLEFNTIRERQELWPKRYGEKIDIDDLFSKSTSSFSEWNEWNYDEHETFYVGHTPQTKLLCHLLKLSNDEISLLNYKVFSGDLENKLEKQAANKNVSPKTNKRKKQKTNEAISNIGIDIRNCMIKADEKKKVMEDEIIEIPSDNSQDNLVSPIKPPFKKPKVSGSLKESVSDNKRISYYEENNNICSLLSKYMLPKNKPKKVFSFKAVLPDLDVFLGGITCDNLIGINVKTIIGSLNIDIAKSPDPSIQSNESSIFAIEDVLFIDENASPCDLKAPEQFSNVPETVPNIVTSFTGIQDMPWTEDMFASKDNLCNKNFELKDLDNANLLPRKCPSDSFNDSFGNVCFNANATVIHAPDGIERPSPSGKVLKTLTSSFMDIHRNNLKMFDSFRERREKASQSATSILDNSNFSDDKKCIREDNKDIKISNPSKPHCFDSNVIFSDDDEFLNIDDDIPNNKKKLHFCSTPVKSTASAEKDLTKNWLTKVCSPSEFSIPSKLASSTPIISVKKFKKNILLPGISTASSSQFYNDVPYTNSNKDDWKTVMENKKSPSPDLWNLSDIIEESNEGNVQNSPQKQVGHKTSTMLGITQMVDTIERGKNKTQVSLEVNNDSTMLGITQMVSLIEREKLENNQMKDQLKGKGTQIVQKQVSAGSVVKNTLSEILESDVDIFEEIEIPSSVQGKPCQEDSVLTQKDHVPGNEDLLLTQKFNTPEKEVTLMAQKYNAPVTDDMMLTHVNVCDIEDKNSTTKYSALKSEEPTLNGKDNTPKTEDIVLTHINTVSVADDTMLVHKHTPETDHMMLTQKYNAPIFRKETNSPPKDVEIDFSIFNDDKNGNTGLANAKIVEPEYKLKRGDDIKDINALFNSDEDEIFLQTLNIPKSNELVDADDNEEFETEKNSLEISSMNDSNVKRAATNENESDDEYIYADLILTQKYDFMKSNHINTDNSPHLKKDQMNHSNETETLGDEKIVQHLTNKDNLSEPVASVVHNQQQSQTVNYKKFNKKNNFSTKIFGASKQDNYSKELKSEKNQPYHSVKNNLIGTNIPNKSASSLEFNSEKSISKTMSRCESSNISFSEPRAKVSLFNSKENSHQLSDDSDEDIFKLPVICRKIQGSRDLPKMSRNLQSPPPCNKSSSCQDIKKSINKEHKLSKKKAKIYKEANGLIETEADVSGEISSDDTDGSSLDDLDNSFINDNTECFTQTMYLKSVKSPVGHGKFKIPSDIKYTTDVYSQHLVEPESEYINDSFCVDSEEESIESNDRSLSLLDIAERKLSKDQKAVQTSRKRRRILNNSSDDSSSPEKKNSPPRDTEPLPHVPVTLKRRRVLSGSESDGSPLPKGHICQRSPSPLFKISTHCHVYNQTITDSRSAKESANTARRRAGNSVKSNSVPNRKKDVIENASNLSRNSGNGSKLDHKLRKLNEKFAQNLNSIRQKYFGSDDSSD